MTRPCWALIQGGAAFVPYNKKSQQPRGYTLVLFRVKRIGAEVVGGKLGERIACHTMRPSPFRVQIPEREKMQI